MREVDKFGCPNLECCYVGFSEGECRECGSELVKPKGDEYQFTNDPEEGLSDPPMATEYDDDPESGLWYSDGGESYSTM